MPPFASLAANFGPGLGPSEAADGVVHACAAPGVPAPAAGSDRSAPKPATMPTRHGTPQKARKPGSAAPNDLRSDRDSLYEFEVP